MEDGSCKPPQLGAGGFTFTYSLMMYPIDATRVFTGLTQIWVNSKALVGTFSQTAGSTCQFWVNRVDFTVLKKSLFSCRALYFSYRESLL
jgi:hypothetical protein